MIGWIIRLFGIGVGHILALEVAKLRAELAERQKRSAAIEREDTLRREMNDLRSQLGL